MTAAAVMLLKNNYHLLFPPKNAGHGLKHIFMKMCFYMNKFVTAKTLWAFIHVKGMLKQCCGPYFFCSCKDKELNDLPFNKPPTCFNYTGIL